jgi:hypothetical protein
MDHQQSTIFPARVLNARMKSKLKVASPALVAVF